VVRRQRTLDALIDQLGKKKSHEQPPDLRLILHLGFYQLRYLNHIPASAAVNTTVELAKQNGFVGLAGVVNGMLRQYMRLSQPIRLADPGESSQPMQLTDPMAAPTALTNAPLAEVLQLPQDPIQRLGVLHSFPDWIVQVWLEQFGSEATEPLCLWMNRSPQIDLRVNLLKTTVAEVESAMQAAGIKVARVPPLPQALRLLQPVGSIQDLPGFQQGWWMVQDSSAQLVGHLLNPQPGEVVIDACAAPGGKATHLAELMGDRGTILACDKTASRLKKVQQNCDRLGVQSIQIHPGDSCHMPEFTEQGDRVLLDVPCSGLGTLHRHADARWRQTPNTVAGLVTLQTQLLEQAATWVKPKGTLVYATCTLHPDENERLIQQFLATHPTWQLMTPPPASPAATFATPDGRVKVLPQKHNMDGFFMACLVRKEIGKENS
jgi:16S rRNA (cytosine967-C5)-methyltransferase